MVAHALGISWYILIVCQTFADKINITSNSHALNAQHILVNVFR